MLLVLMVGGAAVAGASLVSCGNDVKPATAPAGQPARTGSTGTTRYTPADLDRDIEDLNKDLDQSSAEVSHSTDSEGRDEGDNP